LSDWRLLTMGFSLSSDVTIALGANQFFFTYQTD
jgi:hypothetical protein